MTDSSYSTLFFISHFLSLPFPFSSIITSRDDLIYMLQVRWRTRRQTSKPSTHARNLHFSVRATPHSRISGSVANTNQLSPRVRSVRHRNGCLPVSAHEKCSVRHISIPAQAVYVRACSIRAIETAVNSSWLYENNVLCFVHSCFNNRFICKERLPVMGYWILSFKEVIDAHYVDTRMHAFGIYTLTRHISRVTSVPKQCIL